MRVDVPTDDSEVVSSVLWSLHTTGIAELDRGSESGLVHLVAGFETEAEARRAAGRLTEREGREAVAEPVDQPTWGTRERAELTVAGVALSLEVGVAFGHGAHPTTALALDLLAEVGARRSPPWSTLDFGCGTGVLTLAALAHGAHRVLAVDHDPAALTVAAANLDHHHPLLPTDRVTLAPSPDPGPSPDPDRGPSGGPGSVPAQGPDPAGPFDVVVANVLLPVHQEWGPRLGAPPLLGAGGTVVVAGVLVDQRAAVRAAYPGLAVVAEQVDGDWLGLALGAPRP